MSQKGKGAGMENTQTRNLHHREGRQTARNVAKGRHLLWRDRLHPKRPGHGGIAVRTFAGRMPNAGWFPASAEIKNTVKGREIEIYRTFNEHRPIIRRRVTNKETLKKAEELLIEYPTLFKRISLREEYIANTAYVFAGKIGRSWSDPNDTAEARKEKDPE